jgi:hypothetical protein
MLSAAEVTRAFGRTATELSTAGSGARASANNCAWNFAGLPSRDAVTLTIDRYARGAELDAAWQSALDTYLHAGRMLNGLGAPAMWLPKKYGATGLLYLKAANAVCVISVPASGARELRAARSLAAKLLERVPKVKP